jgi:hypothetical protein
MFAVSPTVTPDVPRAKPDTSIIEAVRKQTVIPIFAHKLARFAALFGVTIMFSASNLRSVVDLCSCSVCNI